MHSPFKKRSIDFCLWFNCCWKQWLNLQGPINGRRGLGLVQPPLGMALRTTHIHSTRLTGVRGWAESQVRSCNAHNVWVGVRMAKLVVLQLVQLVGAKFVVGGPTNQEAGARPLPSFPHTMLSVKRVKDNMR
jgi:hypothetical protein